MAASYVGPIRRIKSGKGHRYEDANGRKVPGVTTLLKGIDKPALTAWGPRVTAEYAVDHWDELLKMTPMQRYNALVKARFSVSDPAANRGKDVHDIAMRLIRGVETDVPDEIAGHVESLVHFFDSLNVQPVLEEFVGFSHTHGYAGTGDVVFDLPNGLPEPHPFVSRVLPAPALRLLGDYKTNRGGIYGETAIQCAGYRNFDTYMDSNGVEVPMLEVDGCVGIHITDTDWDVIPLESGPDQLRMLLYAAQVKDFVDNARDLVSEPVRHPSRVQRRRLVLIDGGMDDGRYA
jgi:hypothetical protein